MPLPAGFCGHLAGFSDANFWRMEFKVNGLWNTMLAYSLPLNSTVGSYVIMPEAVPPGDRRLRADLLVGILIGASGRMHTHAVLEGKGSAGDGFDAIYDQLSRFFVNYEETPLRNLAWAIGARGKYFKIWLYDARGAMHAIRLDDDGRPRRLSGGSAPTYDLTRMPQARLQRFLNIVRAHPIVPPH